MSHTTHTVHINHGCPLARCLPAAPFRELAACRLSQKVPALIWMEDLQAGCAMRGAVGPRGMFVKCWEWAGKEFPPRVLWVGKNALLDIAQHKFQITAVRSHVTLRYALIITASLTYCPALLVAVLYFQKTHHLAEKSVGWISYSDNFHSCMHPPGCPWGVSACKSLLKHGHFPVCVKHLKKIAFWLVGLPVTSFGFKRMSSWC